MRNPTSRDHADRLAVLALGCLLLLVGCRAAPRYTPVDRTQDPRELGWGPRNARMEWWYVSGLDVEAGLTFHASAFLAWPPRALDLAGLPAENLLVEAVPLWHVGIADLRGDGKHFHEHRCMPWEPTGFRDDPLEIRLPGWRLVESPDRRCWRLDAPSIHLVLTPQKPRTVHPPGFSGSEATGYMGYQSIPRLRAHGTLGGRAFDGTVWMDHQWGDTVPGEDALWEWAGLHADDGRDLMIYRVTDLQGRVEHACATVTGQDGQTQAIPDVRVTPTQVWTSPTGRTYAVGWRAEGQDLRVDVEPLRLGQEFLSRSACMAYWEGPVRFHGMLEGRRVEGYGMGETVFGFLSRPHGAAGRDG